MVELLSILTPIALIDSLSVISVAIVPLVLLLSGQRPVLASFAFIAGIVLTYFPFGVLLLFGLDAIFESMAARFVEWWSKEPNLGELVLQIIIGLVMIVFGYRLCTNRGKKRADKGRTGMTPPQAFMLAAIINITGMWGALPYFAAVAQILKADFSSGGMLIALAFYNLVFALPLATFLVLRLLLGAQSERWFGLMTDFISRWGGRVLVTVLIGFGLIMMVDGIGWLLGMPLIVPG